MNMMKKFLLTLTIVLSFMAFSKDESPKPAVNGYDLVSYQTQNKAVKGNGWHVSTYKKKSYLFSSKENKAAFDASPTKYLPAYNGWCAFGVAVKKKFYADPTVFEVVDGTLYLNLDKEIQKKWSTDKKKNIAKANVNWQKIRKKASKRL